MDTNTQHSEPPTDGSDSLLSPQHINLYRLRQETALMWICLVAGLLGWFAWLGLRQSDDKILVLIAVMGFFVGGALLLFGLLSTISVFIRSTLCYFRFGFGRFYFCFALLALPFFGIPYYIHSYASQSEQSERSEETDLVAMHDALELEADTYGFANAARAVLVTGSAALLNDSQSEGL